MLNWKYLYAVNGSWSPEKSRLVRYFGESDIQNFLKHQQAQKILYVTSLEEFFRTVVILDPRIDHFTVFQGFGPVSSGPTYP